RLSFDLDNWRWLDAGSFVARDREANQLVKSRGIERFMFDQFAGDQLELVAIGLEQLPGLDVRLVENSLHFLVHFTRGRLAAILLPCAVLRQVSIGPL